MAKMILFLMAVGIGVTLASGSLFLGISAMCACLFFAWLAHRDNNHLPRM